jgi:hypothetical protein
MVKGRSVERQAHRVAWQAAQPGTDSRIEPATTTASASTAIAG